MSDANDSNTGGPSKGKKPFVVPQYVKVELGEGRIVELRWLTGKDSNRLASLLREDLPLMQFVRKVLEEQLRPLDDGTLPSLADDELAPCAIAFSAYRFGLNHDIAAADEVLLAFRDTARDYMEHQRDSIREASVSPKRMLALDLMDQNYLRHLNDNLFPGEMMKRAMGKLDVAGIASIDSKMSDLIEAVDSQAELSNVAGRLNWGALPDYFDTLSEALAIGSSDHLSGLPDSVRELMAGKLDASAMSSISDHAAESAMGLLDLANLTQSAFANLAMEESLSPFLGLSEEFWKELRESQEELEALFDGVQDHQYAYGSDWWVVEVVARAALLDKQERDEILTQHTLELSQSEWFTTDLKAWFEATPTLQPRVLAVEAAIEDHVAGRYWTSVPALIAQCEGVINDIMETKGWARKDGTKMKRTDNSKELGGLYSKAVFIQQQEAALLSASLHSSLTGRFQTLRNGILHGSDTSFGTLENSATAILTLATLAAVLVNMPPPISPVA